VDGAAALRWPGLYPPTTTFETGIEAVLAIHSHQGATEVRFVDGLTACPQCVASGLAGDDSEWGTAVSGRGLLHCYFREHFLMTAREKADVIAKLVTFAHCAGFQLGKIFMERIDSVPTAYQSLVETAAASEVSAVLLPSLEHLAGIGDPDAVACQLRSSAQVEVLVLCEPSFSQGPAWSSAACDTSPQGRPFFQESRCGAHLLRAPCRGSPRAGERVRSYRAASRSPFHPERPVRVSRMASLPPEAPAWGAASPCSIP